MKKAEEWRDIKGYEGLYQVSNLGRVKSLEREIGHRYKGLTRTLPEKIISNCKSGNGYKCVYLMRDKERKTKLVHRLVAETFLTPDSERLLVNHKDFDINNNSVDNLEWCTQKENINYSKERMKHPNKHHKLSITGNKYVYYRKEKNLYRVLIKQFNIEKSFKNIKEAISFRDKVINEQKEYFSR